MLHPALRSLLKAPVFKGLGKPGPLFPALSLLALLAPAARGEPYFSAWKGVSCGSCHINQTGGYARNDFGKSYGEGLMTFDWEGIGEALKPILKPLDHRVAFGADLHLLYTANLDTPNPNSLTNGRQELYFAGYLNKSVAAVFTYRASGSREIYGLVSGLPADGYLKFGTFQLPYGLMLPDDQSYVRTPLGFSFERADTGVEAGLNPGPFFLKAAVFDNHDTPADAGKILSAYWGYSVPEFAVGQCFYNEPTGRGLNTTQRLGMFGWGRLWRLVALGEYDLGFKPDALSPSDRTFSIHGSLEADLGSSVYLRFTREFLNPTYAPGDESTRTAVGLHFFPVQNLQLLAQYQWMELITGGFESVVTLDAHEFF